MIRMNRYTIGQRPIEFLVKVKVADNKYNPVDVGFDRIH